MTEVQPIVIRGARIFDPSQKLEKKGDLWIEDGKIQKLTKPGELALSSDVQIIEASGFWVLPGLIDAHVHLREPGQEHKETIATGTQAAVAGGFTSVACMANTTPVNDCAAVTELILRIAKDKAACRVFAIGAITKALKGEQLADIRSMIKAGARAISDDGMMVMDASLMREAMEVARTSQIPIISHSEDTRLSSGGVMNEGVQSKKLGLRGNPAAAEEIAVARDIALCRLTGCPTHIAHVSTEAAVNHLKRAKETGLPITAEVSPHHLVLTDKAVDGSDPNFKMAPPLRSERDRQAVLNALSNGIIDIIATDHAPHTPQDMAGGFEKAANGIIGLQTAVSLTYELVVNGNLPMTRWIEALTSAPARLLGLPFGTLRLGAAADLVIFNPKQAWTLTEESLFSKSKNTPFLGRSLAGKVLYTLVNGKIMFTAPEVIG